MELLEWYNIIFLAPIVLAAFYLVLSAMSIGADSSHDVDHDVTMDHDVNLGHDLDGPGGVEITHDVNIEHGIGHSVDVGHDIDGPGAVHGDHDLDAGQGTGADHEVPAGLEHVHDAHFAGHHDQSVAMRALSVLGFGRVPVSIIMTCLMVIFGAVGLICNNLFAHVLPWAWAPTVYVWFSLAIAIAASFSLTGMTARGLCRYMPTSETYAVTPADLVGRVGEVPYGLAAGQKGVVDVKDDSGTYHRVTGLPVGDAIPKGREVILVRYHRDGDYYDVSISPL